MKPVIGYTLGDQSGIGPEVISAALASGELPEGAEYRLIGKRVQVRLGRPNAESAKHAFDHLEQAAHALREGTVDAVVTAPVCKETLHALARPSWQQSNSYALSSINRCVPHFFP